MDQFERLMRAAKALHPKTIKNQTSLAVFLNVLPQHITNWKKRGIPKGEITSICRRLGCNADWIELGVGPIVGTEKAAATNVVQPKFESAKDRAIRQVVEMMQGTDEAGCERIVGAVGEALRTYSSQVKANAE